MFSLMIAAIFAWQNEATETNEKVAKEACLFRV